MRIGKLEEALEGLILVSCVLLVLLPFAAAYWLWHRATRD